MLIKSGNPHGGDIYKNKVVYDFSANVSPLGTPEAVKEAIRTAADKICAYPDPYCSALREAVSAKENIPADYIICGNGSADLIYAFAAAVKPKRALIVSPTFCEYEKSLRAVGCDIEYFNLSEESGFIPDDSLTGYINKDIDVVYICNPNNPTGKAYSNILIKSIADKCKENGAILFIDECFCDLTNEPDKHTIMNEINENKNIFIIKAFTKSYGMAGVRLGYAICSDEILLEKICSVTQTWNVSHVAQMAGIAALKCTDFVRENIKIINKERKYLTGALRDLKYTVFESDVNFILFKADGDLYDKLLGLNILIRSCANFRGLDKRFYRAAIRKHGENKAFIEAMEEITNGQTDYDTRHDVKRG
jgi:threonine-phosphate decarboxylase